MIQRRRRPSLDLFRGGRGSQSMSSQFAALQLELKMAEKFVVGEVYFRVKYAERSTRYPLIDSFVFVGKNLSADDTEDIWYFQFTDSFAKYGSITESAAGDRRVSCIRRAELDDMLNQTQLLAELSAARKRRTSGKG